MEEERKLTGEETLDEVERELIALLRNFQMVHSARATAIVLSEPSLKRWEDSANQLSRNLLEILLRRKPTRYEVACVSGIDDTAIVDVTDLAEKVGLCLPVKLSRRAYNRIVQIDETELLRDMLRLMRDTFAREGDKSDKVWFKFESPSTAFKAVKCQRQDGMPVITVSVFCEE